MTNGIYAELVLSTCDGCPVAALSSSTPIQELKVDSDDDRVEFVADDPPDDPPSAIDFIEFADRAHGRYEIDHEHSTSDGSRTADATATDGGISVGPPNVEVGEAAEPVSPGSDEGICTGCSCGGLPAAFANFPASPRRTKIEDSELQVSFILSGHEELRATVDECEAAGLDVELRRLCIDRGSGEGDGCSSDVIPVDLAGVTDRQAEIATVAAEKGYFDPGGASAADIAAEFDLAKSTVSEHLRTVTVALFSQTFGDGT